MPSSPASGVWTLAAGRLIIAEAEGPATILVPTGQVRLLAVDLPLPGHAKRLAALPFAIEDRIAEPLDSVHLALGEALAPGRYLVGVVRHEVMRQWIATAEGVGLGHAAMTPDALILPRPEQGWAVSQAGARAAVRDREGTGFEVPAALLRQMWETAGRPPVQSFGERLPDDMQTATGALGPASFGPAARAAVAALNLRQGAYAVRGSGTASFWKKAGWIVAIGALAHTAIAAADTLMLRSIADRRANETRAAAALAAPGTNLGDDLKATIPDLLPRGGAARAPDAFLPLLSRISAALRPMAGGFTVRRIGFEGRALTMDIDAADPGLAARIDAALRGANVRAKTAGSPDGTIRVTASAE